MCIIWFLGRPFKCSICNLYWSSPEELQKSPFKDVKREDLSEHLCDESTLVKVTDEKYCPGKVWSCTWCPDKFDVEIERNSHEDKEHSSEKNLLEMEHKCLSCSSAYRSQEELLLHRVLEHPKIAAISCLYCDYTAGIQTKEGIGKKIFSLLVVKFLNVCPFKMIFFLNFRPQQHFCNEKPRHFEAPTLLHSLLFHSILL